MVQYNTTFLKPSSKIEFDKRERKRPFIDSCLGAKVYRNADIIPNKDNKFVSGGVVTSDGRFVDNSAVHEGLGGIYEYDKSTIDNTGLTVIYIGFLYPCWGHVITDFLKKLWFLNSIEGNKILSEGAKICYISSENAPPPNYVAELISLAGFDINDWLHITNVTNFDAVIVPDNSIVLKKGDGRYYTGEYCKVIEQIKKRVQKSLLPSSTYKDKIYLTRTHLKNGRDFGEEVIEALFKKRGFTIIAPEEYTPHEQIAMLMHCKELVTTDGSIAHNAVFCMPNTRLTIIRKSDYWNSYQDIINYFADLDVTFIDAHKSQMVNPKAPWHGPFYLCVTPELKKYFNRFILYIPLWLRISWLKYRYKEPLKQLYYTIRANVGLRTRFYKLFSRI